MDGGLEIHGNLNIRGAIDKLNTTGKKILLVVDDENRLIGTITDGDIRRAILRGISLDDTVDKVMNTSPKVLKYPWSKKNALRLFREHGISRIPVVDDEGRVIDLLFLEDFVDGEGSKEKIDIPVVIMAGGKGTRLDPFTKILPKPLIPIGDKPILQIIMDRFYKQGFSRFILTLGYKAEIIKLWVDDADLPYDVKWVVEDKPLGTAGSLRQVVEEFGLKGSFIVSNCDILVDVDFTKAIEFHQKHEADATIIGYLLQNRLPYGVIETDGPYFTGMREKPYIDSLINTGIYVVNAETVYRHIEKDETVDMPEVLDRIRENGGKVAVYPHHGEFFDVGQWEFYKETLRKLGY